MSRRDVETFSAQPIAKSAIRQVANLRYGYDRGPSPRQY